MIQKRLLTRRQQQHLSWGVLPFVVLYFVVCYPMKPLGHADQFSYAGQPPQAAPQHCPHPANASESAAPYSRKPPRNGKSDCCASMEAERTRAFSGQTALLPLPLLTLLPLDLDGRTQDGQQHPVFPAFHAATPPPLYLAYAVLLI